MAIMQFPGTNYHDLNLDWLLSEMKNCLAQWATTQDDWHALQANNTEFKEYMTLQWDGFREFVLNYLHNLPLTQEVNAKINAMVADGTLLELITYDAGEGSALSDVAGQWLAAHITQETGYVIDNSLSVEGAAADAKAVGDALAQMQESIEEQEEKPLEIIPDENMVLFELPEGFEGSYLPFNIYTDGEKFTTDYNKNKFKNANGNTYYVAPLADGGISTNSGLDRDHPKNLYNAINTVAQDGDTIYLLPGYYVSNDTSSLTSASFGKSINIIGLGKVVWCIDGVLFKAQASADYDSDLGVWKCSRSSVGMVISSLNYKFAYTKKTSLEDCQNTHKSWYLSSGTLYINDTEEPDAIIITERDGIVLNTANKKLYFENIMFVGGRWSVQTNGNMTGIFENCIFTRTYGSYSNLSIKGGNVLFHHCEASFSSRDGFAYSPANDDTVQFVEIDCVGENNGLQETDSQSTSNGSTAHSGAKGIRINGLYQHNWGANVADVQAGTQSVNLGCVARDSVGTSGYNEGFSAQQPTATMWLYRCKASGNVRDINATTIGGQNSTLYAYYCDFQTMTIGSGTIVIVGGIVLQSTDDLNDIITEGVYKCYRGSIASAIGHSPVTTMFVMHVYNMDTIYTKQIIFADNGIYSRRKTDTTTWGAWRHADLEV